MGRHRGALPRWPYVLGRACGPQMAVERLLFRAGRQGYTYPEILEVRRGSLRILVPSAESIRRVRITSTLVSLAYIFIGGSLWGAVALRLMPNVGGVAVGVAAVVDAGRDGSSFVASLEDAIADRAPLPADPPRDGDPLSWFRDHGDLEGHVRPVFARGRHDAHGRRRADGHHERLRGLDALDLELLRNPDDPLQQVDLDGHLHEDFREARRGPDDPTDEAVRLCEHRIQVRPDRDESARPDLFARGHARVKGPDRRRDVLPLRLVAEGHLAPGGDLDLLPDLHAALHHAPAEHAPDDLLGRDARLVHIE